MWSFGLNFLSPPANADKKPEITEGKKDIKQVKQEKMKTCCDSKTILKMIKAYVPPFQQLISPPLRGMIVGLIIALSFLFHFFHYFLFFKITTIFFFFFNFKFPG